MKEAYQAAELYHYGFNFRDTLRESAVLLAASDQYGTAGRQFLEIACGNCPYAEDLLRAGVSYHGLDYTPEMLAFARDRLALAGFESEGLLHLANMQQFTLPLQFDLAFVLMGSLQYLPNAAFLDHLDCAYTHLKPGGLYVQEWCIEYAPAVETISSWVEDCPYGEVEVHYSRKQQSYLRQSFEEQIAFSVNGTRVAASTATAYLRYPNEFALLMQQRALQWEVLGHYNAWDLANPLDDVQTVNRPICILRRR